MTPPVVRFLVAGIPLALPLEAVAGVAEPSPVVPLPGSPAAVAGVATVAGSILTVVDLEPLLEPPASTTDAPPPGQAFLLLDRAASGLALRLAAPPACVAAGRREPAPAGRAAALCSHGDRAPDGLLSGVLDPARLLAALGRTGPRG